MVMSDWSSDVCSSDLLAVASPPALAPRAPDRGSPATGAPPPGVAAWPSPSCGCPEAAAWALSHAGSGASGRDGPCTVRRRPLSPCPSKHRRKNCLPHQPQVPRSRSQVATAPPCLILTAVTSTVFLATCWWTLLMLHMYGPHGTLKVFAEKVPVIEVCRCLLMPFFHKIGF